MIPKKMLGAARVAPRRASYQSTLQRHVPVRFADELRPALQPQAVVRRPTLREKKVRTERREFGAGRFGWVLQTVLRPVGIKGFLILPKQWIVERNFSWISRCRRNSKDYKRKPENSEAMILLSVIGLMSKRLTGMKCLF